MVHLGKLEDAIKYYKRGTEIDVEHFQAWLSCTQAWHNLDNYNDTLVSCNTALKINTYYEQGPGNHNPILFGLSTNRSLFI